MQRAEDFGQPLQVASHRARARPPTAARAAAVAGQAGGRGARGEHCARDMPPACGEGKARSARVVYPASPSARKRPRRSRRAPRWSSAPPARTAAASAIRTVLRSAAAFAGKPARREAQDDEVARHLPASSRVMNSRWPASATGSIVMPVSSAISRTTASMQRFARLDHAARQRVEARCWRPWRAARPARGRRG